jgi:ribonuclease D
VAEHRYLNTDRELARLLEHLRQQDPDKVALDLESEHNLHSYGIHISLIQLYDGKSVALIDVLAIRDRSLLRLLLEDTPWIKVMFDASGDLATIRTALDLTIRPIFDLAVAARLLGRPGSLSKLVSPESPVSKSRFQKANWMKRPIPADMLEYAAGDVLPLLDLADSLLAELVSSGQLFRFLAKNAQVQAKTHSRDPYEGYKRLPIYARSPPAQKRLLADLWRAREKYAERHDLPPHNVASHDVLAGLARDPPGSPEQIAAALNRQRSRVRIDVAEFAALLRDLSNHAHRTRERYCADGDGA